MESRDGPKLRKIFVTGVAGLIGSSLAEELLEHDYHVSGIDNFRIGRPENIAQFTPDSRFSFHKGDILDRQVLERSAEGCEAIVHLAALKKIGEDGNAFETILVNIQGTLNVLEVAGMMGAKVVLASTSDFSGCSPPRFRFEKRGISFWGRAMSKGGATP